METMMKPPHDPFSGYLHERLAKTHEKSTQNVFFRALFANRLTKQEYIRFLNGAWYIYGAMERELAAHASDPGIAQIHFPSELNRLASVEADLLYYTGSAKPKSRPNKVVQKYLKRIAEAGHGDSSPHNPPLSTDRSHKKPLKPTPPQLPGAILLLAHSYTRYFGDLSGGQFISLQLQQNWNLPGFQGREFYHFSNIQSIQDFKARYTTGMDSIAKAILDSQEKEDALIDECLLVFRLNDEMLTACMKGDEDDGVVLDDEIVVPGSCGLYRLFEDSWRASELPMSGQSAIDTKSVETILEMPCKLSQRSDGHRTEAARKIIGLLLACFLGMIWIVMRSGCKMEDVRWSEA